MDGYSINKTFERLCILNGYEIYNVIKCERIYDAGYIDILDVLEADEIIENSPHHRSIHYQNF